MKHVTRNLEMQLIYIFAYDYVGIFLPTDLILKIWLVTIRSMLKSITFPFLHSAFFLVD